MLVPEEEVEMSHIIRENPFRTLTAEEIQEWLEFNLQINSGVHWNASTSAAAKSAHATRIITQAIAVSSSAPISPRPNFAPTIL